MMIEFIEIKSATINTQNKIRLKATTNPQTDQHVQYTECLKSNVIKLLANAYRVKHPRYTYRRLLSTAWLLLFIHA